MTKTTNTSGGISFWGLLQLIFITLKLTGHITWSWWLVLLPTLIRISLALVILAVALTIYIFSNK